MRRIEFLSSFRSWAPIVLSGAAMGAALAGTISASTLIAACSSSDNTTTGGDDDGGAGTTTCTTDPGTIPSPTCDQSTACTTAETSCSMTSVSNCDTSSSCLALASNTGTTADFRMRGLYMIQPAALTTATIQGAIVNTGLELKTCGEPGTGLFNWLMSFDLNAMTLKTGAAPVPTDLTGASGFCYENSTEGTSTVTPVSTALHKAADGSYSTDVIPKLNVIFGTADGNVVLPLTNLTLSGVTLSENNNCIGSKNLEGIDNSCNDIEGCNRWHTAGALGSYVTLEDADKVSVVQLQESLCALLVSSQGATTKTPAGLCARDANNKIIATGDYCSTTNSAGGCNDSFWLSATFAASAVKVTDGTGVEKCTTGAATTDGGTDEDSSTSTTVDSGSADASLD